MLHANANTPKVPAIRIEIQAYGSLIAAFAYDETDRFRGDCVSGSREDIDGYIERWKERANEVTVQEPQPAAQ